MTTNTVTQVKIATQKLTAEAEYVALINGINAELVGVDPVILNGTSYPRATLLAKFQSRIDAGQATKTLRTNLRATVANEKALAAEVDPLRQAMKQFLQSRFGKANPKLQMFGFTEAKATQKSVASKAVAVQKMKATRTARHTMGKKQRLEIKAPPSPVATGPTTGPAPIATATAASPTSKAAPPLSGGGVT